MYELIKCEEKGNVGIITFNRENKLNAFNHAILVEIKSALRKLDNNKRIGLIVLKGTDKVFSAGGDLVEVYNNMEASNHPDRYFRYEFTVDNLVDKMKTPTLSFLHGIVMGGGVGISFGSDIRIVDETTKWAMPETRLGMFPDVGVGYYFSQLDRGTALYLSLYGPTIKGQDVKDIGFATHFIDSSYRDEILKKLIATDMSSMTRREILVEADRIVQEYAAEGERVLEKDVAEKYFDKPTLEEIMKALAGSDDERAKEIYEEMKSKCPMSLVITCLKYEAGKKWTRRETYHKDAVIMEYLIESGNMQEGIRKIMIDKSYVPQFRPASIEEVNLEGTELSFLTE